MSLLRRPQLLGGTAGGWRDRADSRTRPGSGVALPRDTRIRYTARGNHVRLKQVVFFKVTAPPTSRGLRDGHHDSLPTMDVCCKCAQTTSTSIRPAAQSHVPSRETGVAGGGIGDRGWMNKTLPALGPDDARPHRLGGS